MTRGSWTMMSAATIRIAFERRLSATSSIDVVPFLRRTLVSLTMCKGRESENIHALSSYGYLVLTTNDPRAKARLTQDAFKHYNVGGLEIGQKAPPDEPVRPARPEIHKNALPSAKALGVSNAVYYLHSLAHVECNAIDLAWDTMLRFGNGNALDWYSDWLGIANDESRHFLWLDDLLKSLDSFYGDLPAHGIIWNSARSTRDNAVERIVLGNLVQEARGLDAGPRLADRFTGMGLPNCASIVARIAEEEKDHVRIGMKWFLRLLDNEKCPKEEFQRIALSKSNRGAFTPPFNTKRREEVGLDRDWYLPVAEMMKKLLQEKKVEAS